jgi:hypothetical protein
MKAGSPNTLARALRGFFTDHGASALALWRTDASILKWLETL